MPKVTQLVRSRTGENPASFDLIQCCTLACTWPIKASLHPTTPPPFYIGQLDSKFPRTTWSTQLIFSNDITADRWSVHWLSLNHVPIFDPISQPVGRPHRSSVTSQWLLWVWPLEAQRRGMAAPLFFESLLSWTSLLLHPHCHYLSSNSQHLSPAYMFFLSPVSSLLTEWF